MNSYPLSILLVEPRMEETLLFGQALNKAQVDATFYHVLDGQQAIDYLSGDPPYSDRTKFPMPDVMITCLLLPRVDGFQLLRWMKERAAFTHMAIVVLSTSGNEADKERAYELGANLFQKKPASLNGMVELLQALYAFLNRAGTVSLG